MDIRAGKVGALVVWRLDRLGRTVAELLPFLEDLDVAGSLWLFGLLPSVWMDFDVARFQ